MDRAVMASLHSWWHLNAARQGAQTALACVCLELARGANAEAAIVLASTALDLIPGSRDALALLERTLDPADRRQLCARYEAFIDSDAPDADVADVRERLVSLLFELGHGYSALMAVDASLDVLAWDLTEDDVRRSYAQGLARAEPLAVLDELAFYLTSCEQPLLAEAAE